jgi:predicted transcriptional regulator
MLATLSGSGGALRRAEARALYAEGLSMDKIADVFGVSRQRVSSLLHVPPIQADVDGWTAEDDARADQGSWP